MLISAVAGKSTVNDGAASAAVKLNATINRRQKNILQGAGAPQQPLLIAVGRLGKESNKHLAKKNMMSVLSIGKIDFCVSNTELDSHANIVVFGNQAFVFSHSGQ